MVSTNAPAPGVSETGSEPSVAGVKIRPAWSIVLYVLLLASAALALWVRQVGGPRPLADVAPWVFLVFAVGFTVYRVALVIARRYPAFKAFSQIFIAAVFFVLLLMPGLQASAPVMQPLPALLGDSDARVRALAAEVAGYRGDQTVGWRLIELLHDPAPSVRDAAHGALVKLAGTDLGGEDAAGVKAWSERFPKGSP